MNYRRIMLVTVILSLGACDGGEPSEGPTDSGTATTMLCSETCGPAGDPGAWSSDGECDDGGEGSLNSYCSLGTDCNDCGVRVSGPPSADAGTVTDAGATQPDAGPSCGDLSPLSTAADRWGQSLDDYAAECCTQAEACAANADCVAYHECLFGCFEGGALDMACASTCRSDHPTYNDGMVYQRFSACIL